MPAGGRATRELSVTNSGSWYDFTVSGNRFERRAAGRLETGRHGVSDPAGRRYLHVGRAVQGRARPNPYLRVERVSA